MNETIRRAPARIVTVHLVAIAAVLSISAAGLPQPEVPFVADLDASGLEYGTAQSLLSARIQAPAGAEWTYGAETVGIREDVLPAYLRRPVTRNPIPPSIQGNAILEEAARYVGVPYRAGGSTPAGFDCTGFITYVYAKFGIILPRSSSSYWSVGTRVSRSDARPGDLIVSDGHVGIYAGGNLQVDAPRPGKTIQFRQIWQASYIFVRVS